jgi:hypothetical protein
MSFKDKIQFDLTLLTSRNQYTVPVDDVIYLEADMDSFGFSAKVGFWCPADDNGNDIFSAMLSREQTEVRIAFQSVIKVPEEKPDPVVIRGPITSKSIEEQTFTALTERTVLYRYFELEFSDTAAVFWKEHFPSEIHVSKSMSDVFDQHCPTGLNLTKLWLGLEDVNDTVAIHLPPQNGSSFYDFVLWYTDTRDGSFHYDNQTNTYYLNSIKIPSASSEKIPYTIIDKIKIIQPKIPRHEVNVLNSYTEDAKKSNIEQSYSVSGIRHDYVIRNNISSDFSLRESLEDSRLRQPSNQIQFSLKDFPWFPYSPGNGIDTEQTDWPDTLEAYNKEMQVKELKLNIRAINEEPDLDNNNVSVDCNVSIDLLLEDRTSLYIDFPDYTPPTYPLQAEGKVISEIGEDDDTTFNLYTDDTTSLDYYSVNVPLWNKDVPVLFECDFLPPHFFFPAYRDSRVLLSFDLHKAEIRRFIEFGPRVQMPMDSQGNHLLFGFNEQSQTSISHMYIDNKPILDIERNTEGESELIRFSDGTILIQTESDESSLSTGSSNDLTPRADAAVADLTIKSQAGMADATSSFDDAKDDVKDSLSSACDDCSSTMDDAEAVIDEKINQASAIVEGAISEVADAAAALEASFQEAKTELQAQLTL